MSPASSHLAALAMLTLAVIAKVRSSVPIEIPECSRYLIGEALEEKEDIDPSRHSSPPLIWMGGRHAWFEINPSPAYLPIYRDICDSIRMYYAILDVYSNGAGRKIDRQSVSSSPVERLSDVFFQVRPPQSPSPKVLLTASSTPPRSATA